MNDETLTLIADLHRRNRRQGPGSESSLALMLALSGIDLGSSLEIADIGCGTGSAAIGLAQATTAAVTAVDVLPPFLEEVERKAAQAGVEDQIVTLLADMANLPFEAEQFDVIWSEGAIYSIGFSTGIAEWKAFLKPAGVLVVTEITWLTPEVPEALRSHWEGEYPEIALASTKLHQLESTGYVPIGYFVLPRTCWIDEYYAPLQAGFDDFLDRHQHSELAEELIAAEKREISMYEEYGSFYGYGCYIARKQY